MSGGFASITIQPAAGNHSYSATYNGSPDLDPASTDFPSDYVVTPSPCRTARTLRTPPRRPLNTPTKTAHGGKMLVVRITKTGRVTIPKAIRDRFDFLPGTDVEFVTNGKALYLVKANLSRGEKLVLRMRGAAGPGMTTDEVLALTRGG